MTLCLLLCVCLLCQSILFICVHIISDCIRYENIAVNPLPIVKYDLSQITLLFINQKLYIQSPNLTFVHFSASTFLASYLH